MADSFDELRTFVRVVEAGGFSGAARTLGISTAMVSKHIAALESRLGARLLDRNTRRTAPTESGSRYYERCVEILRALSEADAELTERSGTVRGNVRVSVPVELATLHVAERLPRLLERHPHLSVTLLATNRMVDLVEEGVDVAVRIVRDYDASLAARPLGVTRLLLVAAPAFLAREGTPMDVAEVERRPALVFGDPSPWLEFPWTAGERTGVLRLSPRLVTSSTDVIRKAAIGGAGIAVLPTMIGGEDLRKKALVRLLPKVDFGCMRIFAVYPHRRHLPAKVRAFVDFLADCFGGNARADPFFEGLGLP